MNDTCLQLGMIFVNNLWHGQKNKGCGHLIQSIKLNIVQDSNHH